jgi:hypothetical protein
MVDHKSVDHTMVDRAMSSCQAEADISQSQRTLEISSPFSPARYIPPSEMGANPPSYVAAHG